MWRLTLDIAIYQLGRHSGEEVHQVDVLAAGAVRTDLIERRDHITFTLMNAGIIRSIEGTGKLDTLLQQVAPRPLALSALVGVLWVEGPRAGVNEVVKTRRLSVLLINEDVEELFFSTEKLKPSNLKASCWCVLQ